MPNKSYTQIRSENRNKNYKLYREIVKIYNSKCAICEWRLPSVTPDKTIHKQGGCDIHHIISFKNNGSETLDNLILLCPNCHKLADAQMISIEEIRQYIRLKPLTGIEWLKDNYKHLYNNSNKK